MPALDEAMQAPNFSCTHQTSHASIRQSNAGTKLFMPALDEAMQAPNFSCTHQTSQASIRHSNAGTKLFVHAPEISVHLGAFRLNQLTFCLQRERIKINLDEFRTHLDFFR